MKKYRIVFFEILISICLSLVAILSGGINWVFQFIVVGIIYFLGGLFFPINKASNKLFVFLKLTGPFFLVYGFIPLVRGYFHLYPIVFNCLLMGLLGIVLNAYLMNRRQLLKTLYAIVISSLLIPVGYLIMINWIVFVSSEKYIKGEPVANFILYDIESHQEVKVRDIKSKVVVLDFWNINCAPCIRQFPELQKLKDYFVNKDILVCSVHINLNKDNEMNLVNQFIRKNRYSFGYFAVEDFVAKDLGVVGTPTIIILNSDRHIMYKGDLHMNSSALVVDNPYDVIRKALQ